MRALIAAVLIFCAASVRASTINAASSDVNDVSNAVFQAVNGDVVVVPAGTSVWTAPLLITNKLITVRGAASWGWYTNAGVIYRTNFNPNNTQIIDEITNRALEVVMLQNTITNVSGILRLTGFEFANTTNTSGSITNAHQYYTLHMMGTRLVSGNSKMRVDHNYIHLNGRIYWYAMAGLQDHNYIDQIGNAGTVMDGRIPDNFEKGHWSWSTNYPVSYGSADEGVYIDSNFCTNFTPGSQIRGITDGFCGARFVARYNYIINGSVENHGTDSAQENRGTRWMSVYGNYIKSEYVSAGEHASHYRSGTGNVFSNTVVGSYPGVSRWLNYRHSWVNSPYGLAQGTNVWDVNEVTVYESGTHTGTNGSLWLMDSNKTWTAHQWETNYTVYNMDPLKGISTSDLTCNGGEIQTSGTTNIMAFGAPVSTANLYWSNGNPYRILKVISILDGCGTGAGRELTGGNTTTQPTPVGYPNLDDPIYVWNNVGITNVSNSLDTSIKPGTNWIFGSARPGYTPLGYPHPWDDDVPGPPDTISTIGTIPGVNQITVTWTSPDNTTGFIVQRSTSSGGTYATIGTTAATSLTDATTGHLTPYYYKVCATNVYGVGNFSAYTTSSGLYPPWQVTNATIGNLIIR